MSGQIIGPIGVLPAAVTGLALNTSTATNFTTASSFALTGLNAPVNCVWVVGGSWASIGGTITVTGVSDPTGSYTSIANNAGSGLFLFYAVRTSSQSGNIVTITTSAPTTLSASLAVFSGVNTSTPIDTSGTYSGDVAGPSPVPAWTTSIANTILVGEYGPNSGQFTVSGGTWALIPSPNTSYFSGMVWEIVSSSGVQSAPTTSGDSGLFGSITTAFRA